MTQTKASRHVAVAGATGLVGRNLIQQLCADSSIARVQALVRRASGMKAPRLVEQVVDFADLPALPPLDELYLALGTTIKVAGSRAAFRAVDLDANLAVARAAQAAGARRIGLVSALGASPKSSFFYNRVKGELEQALASLELEALVIARPSLLRGDRAALGQQPRAGESWASRADALLRPVMPRGWRAIDAADVAAALVRKVPKAQGCLVLSSAEMQGLGAGAKKLDIGPG